MRSLVQDLQFALRTLSRRRTFALVAITTIALGIGATTSIYSIVDGVLLRPLPWREPQRLVQVQQIFYKWKGDRVLDRMWDRIPLGVDEFELLRDRNTVFDGVGIWSDRGVTLTGTGAPEQLSATLASASLLGVLGERVIRGRGFSPGEDDFGGPNVALVSFEAWQRRFGGRDDAIGKFVRLDSLSYEIVGVLPSGLRIEQGATSTDFWTPTGHEASDRGQQNRGFRAVARLKQGVTIERAEANASALLSGTSQAGPKGVRLADWHVEQTRDSRTPLFLLLGAVGLLLLIACVNVATLLLGESATRAREMAVRVSLGAGRLRLVRQLLTESVTLAVVGAAFGTLLAWWGTRAAIALAPTNIPGLGDVRVDLRVLVFSSCVALVTGLLFGLAPALSLSRLAPASLMRSGTGQSIAGRGRLQRVLVATELALSFVLLVGSGLLSRSLAKLTAVDPGFRTENLLLVRFSLPSVSYPDSLAVRQFYARATERLSSVPGVAAVTASSSAPFTGNHSSSSVDIEGHPLAPGEKGRDTEQRTILSNFFQTMEIPLVAGRSFTDDDRSGAELVVVVNETMARRDWPNELAVGKHVKYQGAWRTVVGVAADIRYGKLSAKPDPTIFTPFLQRAVRGGLPFLVRTRVPSAVVARSVRAALLEGDPNLQISTIDEMVTLVRRSFAEERFRTTLVSLFGALAAVLAAIGMYGVTSRAVARRTREVGIRVALGATGGSVIRLMVGSTLAGVAIGVAVGLLTTLAAANWAAPLLYGISARDPVTYVAILAFLALVSVVATWLPARRASRVQPAVVLRGE
jgi:predicted permease